MADMDGKDLAARVQEIAARIKKRIPKIDTEEATKHSLVLPVLQQVLGYNVFDPHDVKPEYVADIGARKGEKCDYAILQNEEPVILVECKMVGANLDGDPVAQLSRYFHCTPAAHFGILTDGVQYRFFSDLVRDNTMDGAPFMSFDFSHHSPQDVEGLGLFTKPAFSAERCIEWAKSMRYRSGMMRVLKSEWDRPSNEFVRHLAKEVYGRYLNPKAVEQMRPICVEAMRMFVTERANVEPAQTITAPEPAQQKPPPAVQSAPVEESKQEAPKTPRVSGFVFDGTEIAARSGIQTLVEVVKKFQMMDSTFITRFDEKTRGRRRRLVARSKEELYDNPARRKHWAALHSGWFLGTHIPTAKVREHVKTACDLMGVEFGSRLTLIEKRWNQ